MRIIFLSSLEHFPFCVGIESQYKEGQDIVGYKKALSILKENGLIFLTVPFGKYRWQAHHQNYDWNGIKQLTEGSEIIEHFTYRLSNDDKFWNIESPETMDDILYTDKAHGAVEFIGPWIRHVYMSPLSHHVSDVHLQPSTCCLGMLALLKGM